MIVLSHSQSVSQDWSASGVELVHFSKFIFIIFIDEMFTCYIYLISVLFSYCYHIYFSDDLSFYYINVHKYHVIILVQYVCKAVCPICGKIFRENFNRLSIVNL